MNKDYGYYKSLVQKRGIVLKYPEDCGCEACQVTYAWIEDGAPGLSHGPQHAPESAWKQLLTGQEP